MVYDQEIADADRCAIHGLGLDLVKQGRCRPRDQKIMQIKWLIGVIRRW
jgi:hypothetical protein